MLNLVFATHDELGSCRVSGHRWVWIKMIEANEWPWLSEVEYECDYCGAVEYVTV
jgi:hypothetical protein